ncbi:MAG: HAMP domain-containing sensor histidine kinase, partial [Planctomycetota bacterium]
MLLPLVLSAVLAVLGVAVASYQMGTHRASQEMDKRYQGIRDALSDASFPLNAIVLDSLAALTQTELVALATNGKVSHATVPLSAASSRDLFGEKESFESQRSVNRTSAAEASSVKIGQKDYSAMIILMTAGPVRPDGVRRVVVLFDETQIDATRRRAVILPLATGMSTIVALSSITLWLSSRLVSRIGRLQVRVQAVASGKFESNRTDFTEDEIGRLDQAVDSMAGQLQRLWKTVHRQQGEKLLHQIAGGLAHQLRNGLTGARMAIELHANQCDRGDDEEVAVAIKQMETSEEFVRRLMLVASGRQDEDRPAQLGSCWDDVRSSLEPMAKHLRVSLIWDVHPSVAFARVSDGTTWVAAATNLIQNAMQAGNEVQVKLSGTEPGRVRLTVIDNGDGVDPDLAEELFEPFVTSKPEGMGLGLAVVHRAAERLGGQVTWCRR